MDKRLIHIGDYFMYHHTTLVQVMNIYDEKVDSFNQSSYSIHGLYPIEVTPQLLENNGWMNYGSFLIREIGILGMEWNLKEKTIAVMNILENRRIIILPAKFVHQLQHILRELSLLEEADEMYL